MPREGNCPIPLRLCDVFFLPSEHLKILPQHRQRYGLTLQVTHFFIIHAIGNTAYVIHAALGYSHSSKEHLIAKGIIKKVIMPIIFAVYRYKHCFYRLKQCQLETHMQISSQRSQEWCASPCHYT